MILKTAILNIKKNIKQNPLVFFVMMLAQIISFICVLFSFGIANNTFKIKQDINISNTTFDVNLTPTATSDEEALKYCYKFSELEKEITEILSATEGKWEKFTCYGFVCVDNNYLGFCAVDANVDFQYTSKNKITLDDMVLGNNVVAANSNFPCNLGDKISLGKKEYEVISVDSSYYDSFIIPYNSLNDDFYIRRLKISFHDIPSKITVENVNNKLNEFFNNVVIEEPQIPDLMTKQYVNTAIIVVLITSIIVVINLCYLYRYLLERKSYVIYIYRLLGCGRIKAIATYCTEVQITSIISALIALAIFINVILPIATKNSIDFEVYYTIEIITILLLCYTLISIIILILTILPIINQSIINMKRGIK